MNNKTCSSERGALALIFFRKLPEPFSAFRSKIVIIVTCFFALVVASGCASTKMSTEQLVTEQLPRPATLWVYDFAATATDVPSDSALSGQYSEDGMFQTAEHIEIGRKLGAQIGTLLAEYIRDMGLPAEHTVIGTTPPIQINDIVIRGYLISFEEGSTAKRVAIGFGSGTSELKVYAEAFQMTAQGLRKLESDTTDSGGNKTPGTAVGVASLVVTGNPVGLIVGGAIKVYWEKSGRSKVEGRAKQTAKQIAAVLKKRFEHQGWIN